MPAVIDDWLCQPRLAPCNVVHDVIRSYNKLIQAKRRAAIWISRSQQSQQSTLRHYSQYWLVAP